MTFAAILSLLPILVLLVVSLLRGVRGHMGFHPKYELKPNEKRPALQCIAGLCRMYGGPETIRFVELSGVEPLTS